MFFVRKSTHLALRAWADQKITELQRECSSRRAMIQDLNQQLAEALEREHSLLTQLADAHTALEVKRDRAARRKKAEASTPGEAS